VRQHALSSLAPYLNSLYPHIDRVARPAKLSSHPGKKPALIISRKTCTAGGASSASKKAGNHSPSSPNACSASIVNEKVATHHAPRLLPSV
jgi:hypothetical protein